MRKCSIIKQLGITEGAVMYAWKRLDYTGVIK